MQHPLLSPTHPASHLIIEAGQGCTR